jgi:diguanylate cyclase (GGDEF)-like protein
MEDKIQVSGNSENLLTDSKDIMFPLCVVGVCCFVPFFLYDLTRGNYLLSATLFAVTLVFAVNGYGLYRNRKSPIPFEVLLVPSAGAIVLSIIYQGSFGTYWCYPLLLFFYFVLSRRMANICAFLLLVSVTIIVFQYHGRDLTTRFSISLSVLIVMANIIVRAITNLHGRLLEQTIKDPLTGAFNRRYMKSHLGDAVAQRRRHELPASILLFDIDFFKRINDEYGHAAGDEVIKGVVNLITERIRQSDKLFRIGGEEFLLFLPGTGEENAATVAEHLRLLIADTSLLDERKVTVSIGISELGPDESLDDWIKFADDALYRAKENGRNRHARRNSPRETAAMNAVSVK